MKNVTLPRQFFADILQLDPQSQLEVLTTCQQLAVSDEDTIEHYTLPADSPAVLTDFVKRLKRRVRCARRRRERPASPPKAAKKPDSSVPAPDGASHCVLLMPETIDQALTMLHNATTYLINNLYDIDHDTLYSLRHTISATHSSVCDLQYFIETRVNAITAVIPTSLNNYRTR